MHKILILTIALFSQITLRGDLVAHWTFDEFATIGDDIIGGNSLSGSYAHVTNGKFGGSIYFGGNETFLAGDVSALPTGDSPYSISAWIKTTDGNAGIVGWGNYGTTRQVNALRTNGNGIYNYWWSRDLQANAAPDNLLDDEWHHVVATYDGTTRRLYIDGVEKASDTPTADLEVTNEQFTIGTTNTTENFIGEIDELGIYDHALNATEIEEIFVSSAIVTNTKDSGPGSLRQAIADCAPGGVITFNPSLANKTITLISGELLIDKSLRIYAASLSKNVTIDANDSSRVMKINQGNTVTLDNLTLTGGTSNIGGAIYIEAEGIGAEATLKLNHCTISGNKADFGGGIASSSSQYASVRTTLENCSVFDNLAEYGGGILIGGIDNGTSHLLINSSTIFDNHALKGGGGIACINNQSSFAETVLNNSTLAGNSTDSLGGAIYNNTGTNAASTIDLIHCTITENSATTEGGGVFTVADTDSFTLLQLDYTILSANSAPTGTDLQRNSTTVNYLNYNFVNENSPTDPKLSPLGYYGGPTMTMHPLSTSILQITSESNITRTDQRGYVITGPPTIGAVKVGPKVTVSNELELRQEIGNANPTPGKVITFSPSLNGNTILLTNGQLTVPSFTYGLFIDASELSDGVTIDANQASRVLGISPNAFVGLHGLSLTGGNATGSGAYDNYGGAIFSDGRGEGNAVSLALSSCSVFENSAGEITGGICSYGVGGSARLSLNQCSIYKNNSGGISSVGDLGCASLRVSRSTITQNITNNGQGGGIYSSTDYDGKGLSTVRLKHNTITENHASGLGGGVYCAGTTKLFLNNTILTGNTATFYGADLMEDGTGVATTATGANLISNTAGINSDISASTTTVTDPKLSPLGDYGGLTYSMPPLPGSPALDSSEDSSILKGQRGFTISDGNPDIGAVEYQGEDTELDLAFEEDLDGDRIAVGVELAIGTDPYTADRKNPKHLCYDPVNSVLTYGIKESAQEDIDLRLVRSTDLVNFEYVVAGNFDANNIYILGYTSPINIPYDMQISAKDLDPPAGGKAFYRLEAYKR